MSNETKQTEKICTGCGRSNLNPIEEQYAACCPDNNYVNMSNETSETLTKFLNDKRMTNNKQQTAVDSIIEFMKNNQYFIGNDLYEFMKQAKEMEKEQMIEFGKEVFICRYNGIQERLSNIANDIYNETYGGNK